MQAIEGLTHSHGIMVTETRGLSTYSVPDNLSKVQSESMTLEFSMRSGTNSIRYQDQIGLQTDFAPEIKATADVESLLAEGSEYVNMLYTFRSVGRAVPMANDQNSQNKKELNLQTFFALQPQVAKIRRLMDFQEKGVAIIERCMRSLVTREARERIVPDGYYDAITKVVDLLQKLDNLKDMKASLATDFSRYNRVKILRFHAISFLLSCRLLPTGLAGFKSRIAKRRSVGTRKAQIAALSFQLPVSKKSHIPQPSGYT